ncbi:hypothetical protein L202_04013 [Cryptococcus amylolentus CBS 6039]|uniref:NADH:flavin oxidoreductase/NADH oxidase N-terminal domain-containing protein n=2 Tax=Cryptococcus amylolentus TaxID=104669 RepID=A0A1E3HPX3_9TREE|nr:hypothetical protein L202_04013 [Cryptococcus amylolentus CBS 6039]ODN78372.1 hypothetical protein L202_04013 [Cryptococcus amylolentus CBS 6039]
MAPMTRGRANPVGGVIADFTYEYYAQRASPGGLLISEGTVIAKEAGGFPQVPGIYNQAHIDAWKKVTAAVHEKGGKIACQLWASGRAGIQGAIPKIFAPSNVPLVDGAQELSVMTEEDIERFIEHYRQAAVNAMEAGFDAVELHGANGYLIDQFVQKKTNQRTDAYAQPTFLFPLRVLSAVTSSIGAHRVGLRISPFSRFKGMRDADPLGTFVPYITKVLEAHPDLAYIHAIEPRAEGFADVDIVQGDDLQPIRRVVQEVGKGVKFIVAGGYTMENAKAHADETGDLVAFGRFFTSNPDLAKRIQNGWPLQKYDRPTFYSPGREGYVDFLEYQAPQASA